MPDPTPVETPYGTLYVDPEELVIGRLLQANGQLPDISQEVAFFRKYLKPGDTAIDVGANYGLFTLALAQIVGKVGGVIAYEPNTLLHGCLVQTMTGLSCRFAVTNIALGREPGWGSLRLDPRGSGGTQILVNQKVGKAWITGNMEASPVRIDTLDASTRSHHRPIKAIKIDAEGMDVDVLLGAENILREDRPAVIFEWNPEAMKTLSKAPEEEFMHLLWLSSRVDYDVTTLDGELWPERLAGNLAFVPEV